MEATIVKQKPQYIRYGLSLDYVPKWGIQQALREIYQNYIDYGDYEEDVIIDVDFEDRTDPLMVEITLRNGWNPEDFNFLVIGGSNKDETKIGKYGEGLKLAFLVFLRNSINATMCFNQYIAKPVISENKLLGANTYSIKILSASESEKDFGIEKEGFITKINIPKEEYDLFRTKILDKTKIIFSCDYGDVIDYPKGTIFIGGIWVCNVNGFSKAYNFKPQHVPLDRDREIPASYDIERFASYIQQLQNIIEVEDLGCDDNRYIQEIPEALKDKVEPKLIAGANVEFVSKETGEVLPKKVTQLLSKDERFKEEVQTIRENANADPLEYIKDFKDRHIPDWNIPMNNDYKILMNKLGYEYE
jgi:hypothetical protein